MEQYLGICFWYNHVKRYGCIADLSGTTHLFKTDCLARDYTPTPGDIIVFRITFDSSTSARNDRTIISLECADIETVCDEDLESLTRIYATFQEKNDAMRNRQAAKGMAAVMPEVRQYRSRWEE